jgi:hypothetical protein
MTSKTGIFNMALILLEQRIVNSPTQDIITAINLLNVYDVIRSEMLRSFPWNFAIKRVALAQTDDPLNEYAYAYTIPSDCLKILEVFEPSSSYVIEGTDASRVLLTDDATVEIRYIRDITDESLFDASFVKAFAEELALAVGPSLGVTDSALERIRKKHKETLKTAKGTDAQEDYPINLYPSSTWIKSR